MVDMYVQEGTQKFLELLKNLFKIVIQVWNFSPLQSTPPKTGCSDHSATRTTGNTVYNIQLKCCQGLPAILAEPLQRQQNASLLAKNKMVVVPSPYSPDLAPCDFLSFFFFFVPRDESGLEKKRHFANIAEVQRESLVALDSFSVEDFRKCFQQWEKCWHHCIQSNGEYFEQD